jgi:hypothetical protein
MGHDAEQFVEPIEPWPRMSTFQNGELLAKRRFFLLGSLAGPPLAGETAPFASVLNTLRESIVDISRSPCDSRRAQKSLQRFGFPVSST